MAFLHFSYDLSTFKGRIEYQVTSYSLNCSCFSFGVQIYSNVLKYFQVFPPVKLCRTPCSRFLFLYFFLLSFCRPWPASRTVNRIYTRLEVVLGLALPCLATQSLLHMCIIWARRRFLASSSFSLASLLLHFPIQINFVFAVLGFGLCVLFFKAWLFVNVNDPPIFHLLRHLRYLFLVSVLEGPHIDSRTYVYSRRDLCFTLLF